MNIPVVRDEMLAAAHAAAEKFFKERLGGVDQYACGFAWLTVYPVHKGNTRAGRAERRVLEQMGFRKDWTGKAYEFWDPSKYPCQNVDTKEAGAIAAANILRKHGFRVSVGSRLD